MCIAWVYSVQFVHVMYAYTYTHALLYKLLAYCNLVSRCGSMWRLHM